MKALIHMRWLLAAVCVVVTGTVQANYSDENFEAALRGYLNLAHDNLAEAAQSLYRTGSKLKNPEILRDATYAAVRLRNRTLSEKASSEWYANGGGTEALNVLVRLKVAQDGLPPATGLLSRLAEKGDPALVYAIIKGVETSPRQIEALRGSHPVHLRTPEYFAYLALLMLANNESDAAYSLLDKTLRATGEHSSLLMVGLLITEASNDNAASILIAKRLATAAETDLGTAMVAYNTWKSRVAVAENQFPTLQQIAAVGETAQSLLLAAGFLLNHNAPQEALPLLLRVPHQSPERPFAVSGLVQSYRALGDSYQQDIFALLTNEMAKAPAELVPRYARAYAEELRRTAGNSAALVFLSNLSFSQDDIDILFEISVDADIVGEFKIAEASLRRYIELAPESSVGHNALAYLYAVHDINLKEARQLVMQAMLITPDSAAIIDTYGWVLYRLGDLNGAVHQLQTSLSLLSEPNPEILAHLGEVLWEQGQVERAKQVWQQALDLAPDDPYLRKTLEHYADQVVLDTH